jgi:hypothetical protein
MPLETLTRIGVLVLLDKQAEQPEGYAVVRVRRWAQYGGEQHVPVPVNVGESQHVLKLDESMQEQLRQAAIGNPKLWEHAFKRELTWDPDPAVADELERLAESLSIDIGAELKQRLTVEGFS